MYAIRCRDFLIMSMNLNDIAILKIKNVDYCWFINGIGKSEAINLSLTSLGFFDVT